MSSVCLLLVRRLRRFEVEGMQPFVPSDITMSDAPGDGGDDDP
jgi:hypothetical protein